jgi:hypothetical protein
MDWRAAWCFVRFYGRLWLLVYGSLSGVEVCFEVRLRETLPGI